MAWRDSRSSRRHLLLFVSSMILGIAALVAIGSLSSNVREAIESQTKSLLGADLVIRSQRPWTSETEAILNSIGGEQSREVSFPSMIRFSKHGGTRLAQIRAIEGGYPFYGKLETAPSEAAFAFKTGPYALVETGLMLQFGAEVGDSIKIGAFTYQIIGTLKKVPGEIGVSALIGSRVFIPMTYLNETRLLQRGSLAGYKAYFKLNPQADVEQLVKTLKSALSQHLLDSDTVEEYKASLGQAMENLYHFLNLVGFIAVCLGGIGVASAIHVYVKQKLNTVAVLHCLGTRTRQTFAIYLIQVVAMGLVGGLLGALLGIGIQSLLPKLLTDFLPVTLRFAVSWSALLQGLLVGLGISILFGLLPLISIRKVSPLSALRSSYEERSSRGKDSLRWWIYLLIALSIGAFATAQTQRWTQGLAFTGALILSFGLLTGVAKLITFTVRTYLPSSWTYVWRQGLANLYRPNNQTLVMMVSLGLGTFLIMTLYLVHRLLLSQVSFFGSGNQPNLVLFDIQSDQTQEVAQLLSSFHLPVQQVPIVTMRLSAIKGKNAEEIMKGCDVSSPEWALRREYRSTYRESLTDTEKIVAGTWRGRVDDSSEAIPISLEEGLARLLKVSLGDELVFDVQGVPVVTRVSSLRKVEWQRVKPNFFVVFPTGVLEGAPQIYAQVTRVRSNEMSAKVQQAVVERFPNVSAIDLGLILTTLDDVLSKIAFGIRFMALFSIGTGLTVLAGATITGRYQRIKESVLLRTLGASRGQIRKITVIEYLFLGSFAALTGLILSIGSTWALVRFVFETPFVFPVIPNLIAFLLITGLTILVGMLNSRGIYDRPPLEVLRVET